MKTTILATSILVLALAGPAAAQTTAPAETPAQKMERLEKSDPAAKPAVPADKSATHGAAHDGNWRASNLMGANVVNAANESIGDINDLLIDNEGKIASVVVGVGGFLGIGEKNVALQFTELAFSRNANGNAVVTSKVTKETLEKMPEWKKVSTKM